MTIVSCLLNKKRGTMMVFQWKKKSLFFVFFMVGLVSMHAKDNSPKEVLKQIVLQNPSYEAFLDWADTQSLPFIEGDYPKSAKITFVYYNVSQADKILLKDVEKNKLYAMKKQGNSDIWSLKKTIKNPESFLYQFVEDKKGKQYPTYDILNLYVSYANPIKSQIRRPASPDATTIYTTIKSETPYGKNITRDILISLPEGYFSDFDKDYPVLYMHDGQQILDSNKAAYGGWRIDTTAQQLAREGLIEPIIVVGIFNSSQRDHEMMGWSPYHQEDSKADDAKMYADVYDYFVTKAVKDFIDSNYRTKSDREHTAIGGASSGAMVALYELFIHPELYSMAAALSGGYPYYDDLRNIYFPNRSDSKIYLDCGTVGLDGKLLVATQTMDAFLRQNGYREDDNYFYQEMKGHDHNEYAWSKRVADFLTFFFGRKN